MSTSTSARPARRSPPTARPQRIAEALGCGVLVNLGGDVAVAGPAPTGGWGVGHRPALHDGPADADEVVAVHAGGLASSGTTARTWTRAGRTLHHIVDPWTGRGGPVDLGARLGAGADLPRGQRLVDGGRSSGARTPRATWPPTASPPGSSPRTAPSSVVGRLADAERREPGGGVMLAATSTSLTTAVWYTIRATGVVALVLLTVTTVLGLLSASRVRTRRWPAFAQVDLHKRATLLALVFLALHVVTAVVDTYVRVGLLSAVVPFVSPFRTVWTGLGAVAVDLLAGRGRVERTAPADRRPDLARPPLAGLRLLAVGHGPCPGHRAPTPPSCGWTPSPPPAPSPWWAPWSGGSARPPGDAVRQADPGRRHHPGRPPHRAPGRARARRRARTPRSTAAPARHPARRRGPHRPSPTATRLLERDPR